MPPTLLGNLTASLLRLAEEGLARPPPAATAAAAAAQLAAFTYLSDNVGAVANASKWEIMRVSRLGSRKNPLAPKQDIQHPPAMRAALALPCVAALIKEHNEMLWEPLLLRSGQSEKPRNPVALAAARKAFDDSEPGTWRRFSKA